MDEKMLATALRHYCPIPGFFFFVGLSFLGQLFSFLLLHPADEQHTHDDNIGNAHRHPHDESAKCVMCGRKSAPYRRRGNERSIEGGGEGQPCSKKNRSNTGEKEVQPLPADRETGQVLRLAEHRPPVQDTKDDEGEVFQDMNILVLERCVIQWRGMPEPEIYIVEDECDGGVCQRFCYAKCDLVAY